jgi:energy-coupling factor transporter transmembrane protein EcfT
MPHPAASLLVWGAAAVALQLLHATLLYVVAAVVLGLAIMLSGERLLRLLRRTRWLLLAIALLFSLSTPGLLVLPQLGVFSPTADGLQLAATHLTRLVAVLASLALLLEYTPPAAFVGALFGLLSPAAGLGLDRERVAVRLMLVMQYAEAARGGNWREWLDPAAPAGPERIALTRMPWRWHDGVLLAVALSAAAGLIAA